MARLMVVQCSGRRKGYTATLMNAAVDSLKDVDDIVVEVFHLHDYTIGPCTSCFSCIRKVGSGCILKDDWGRKGEGVLYQAFKRTNGLLMVDPVHGWGISVAAHAFMERIYPTFWEGVPYGLPFASVSCASNQGFQYRATQDFCKAAAGMGCRYIGGLPVHVVNYTKALEDVRTLARNLAEAAIEDERDGRTKPTDESIFLNFNGAIFDLVEEYLRNLTNSTFSYEESIPVMAVKEGLITNPEALPLIEKVCEHLKKSLEYYHGGNREDAARELALTAKFWTNGTYLQCCQNLTVDAKIPETYRPLDDA